MDEVLRLPLRVVVVVVLFTTIDKAGVWGVKAIMIDLSNIHVTSGGRSQPLAAMFSYHLVHTSPICRLPIVFNDSSFDGWCNTSFDWTRKEKQRMDGTDTEGPIQANAQHPPSPWRPCFSKDRNQCRNRSRYILSKNILSKVHEDWTKTVSLQKI
ncbi:hypothetical protein DPMN_126689 [Dreissena polymorpha]|uniref:Uncharacterized protein n=1 Tax=Dreissena polymorpha TaxID=45954 RepID=A0A9D4GW78_DREPO|nr:hypothetical protein DPMN_126689 [Dreissena polymorpha]